MSKEIIPASDEAWENRSLGNDESFVKVVDEAREANIDEASGTQMISIRVQKSLIEDFKMIASLNGNIGYQTLMKQIMQRFVTCEKKRIFNELVSEKIKEQQKIMASPEKRKTPREKQRKAA
jgi:predicted DNA binding CopG/RHH family protein